jgi:pimeloyl-ACP methyl ester carboxylesterase
VDPSLDGRAGEVLGETSSVVSTDVIRPEIEVCAQYALLRMRNDPTTAADAVGMLEAVKTQHLAGIHEENVMASVRLAAKLGRKWWELIPKGEDAALVVDPVAPATVPPTIVFRSTQTTRTKDGEHPPCLDRTRLDPALSKAWATFQRLRGGQLVQCEVAQATPIVFAEAGAFGAPAPVTNIVPPILCAAPARPPVGPIRFPRPGRRERPVPVAFGGGLPVIIVPGIVGTRLVEPVSRAKVFNPTSWPPRANANRLEDPATLDPDPTPDNIPLLIERPTTAEEARLRAVPNFGNLVYDFYAKLVIELTEPTFQALAARVLGTPLRVFIAGYDWRRSSAISAARLEQVVERALEETGAPQAVIVAHSMGGLVSRWYCRFGGASGVPGSGKVCALILVGSPTHGTPKAYRLLRFGFDPVSRPGDRKLALLFFDRPGASSARMFQRFPSTYELLPTQHFCTLRNHWLRFDARRAGIPDSSIATLLYSNPHTGIGPGPVVAAMLRARAAFDASLGLFMPNPTFVIFSKALRTEGAYTLAAGLLGPSLRDRASPDNVGDATVTALSGRADGCFLGARGARIVVGPVEHDVLAINPTVIRHIKRVILNACPAVPPATPGGVLAMSRRTTHTG